WRSDVRCFFPQAALVSTLTSLSERRIVSIRTQHPRSRHAARRITVPHETRRDHTIGPHALLYPTLEGLEQTVIRIGIGTEPLTDVVRLVATSAMSHPGHDVQQQEIANGGVTHPS